MLGDHRGAERLLAALEAAGDVGSRRRPRGRAAARGVDRGLVGGPRARPEPRRRGGRAWPAGRSSRRRCAYYLAYVVSHHGEWEQALELTARARELYDGLDRPWDQAANALFAARAAISAGDTARAAAARDEVERWLQAVDDPWLHVRRDAMLGELARVEHRFEDAVDHIGRAAETSGRLGFRQTEAYQVTSLGRAQCQAGDYEAGAETLALGIGKAEATGDVRLAALGRVHLGPRAASARPHGGGARRARAGGGVPSRCRRRRAGAARRLPARGARRVRGRGRERRRGWRRCSRRRASDDDAPVEVFALDALGRLTGDAGLYELADGRMADA